MRKIQWTIEDSLKAQAEGWAICQCDSDGHPPWELSSFHDAGIFMDGNSADDSAAVAFVVANAENGNPFHLRALLFVEQNAPQEANHWKDQGMWPLWLSAVLDNIDTACAPLESALGDSIGYVIHSIGSSYCDTDDEDWRILHELEDAAGVPRTQKSAFY